MSERYLQISKQDLSLPQKCPSPDVIAVIYLIKPGDTIEKAKILDIKCRHVQCSVKACQYKNIVSFKKQI